MIRVVLQYKERFNAADDADKTIEIDADFVSSQNGILVLHKRNLNKLVPSREEEVASFASGEWIYWEKV